MIDFAQRGYGLSVALQARRGEGHGKLVAPQTRWDSRFADNEWPLRRFPASSNSLKHRRVSTVTYSRQDHGNLLARKPVDKSGDCEVIHGNLVRSSTVLWSPGPTGIRGVAH